MKAFCLFWICLLSSQWTVAQMDSLHIDPENLVRRQHAEYDEEILYFGRHNEYFTVKIYRKNGDLLRFDTYKLLPKLLPNGFPLDSLSRITRYGPTKIFYKTGRVYINCEYKDDMLQGPFMVFYEDGAIKRREYYKYGRVTQSKCYGPEGDSHRCEPFYQPTQFVSKSTELSAYLKQKLESVLDGEQIRKITATLTINEIGQVINVNVSVNAASTANQKVPVVANYVQQVIRNMPEWTPDKLNWKPAVNDGVAISATCVLSVFRIYGALQYNLSARL